MTTEELNQALFEKVNNEMKHFSNWLLKQTPEKVLNHAYEYVTKFDIISDIECIELSDERARALLQSDTPLEDIYKAYDNQETSVMDIITDCIESRADAVIVMNSETSQKPVYPYSGDYAQEHGEVDQYRESNKLNIACKQAIQTAIASHHDGMRLDPEAAHSSFWRTPSSRRITMVGSLPATKPGQDPSRSSRMKIPLVTTAASVMY